MPAACSASSAAAVPPASTASADRSILRRWPNAASITANTCSRVLVQSGGSRRVMRTSPDSTCGAGQKTDMPMLPAGATSQYQRAFTLGTP